MPIIYDKTPGSAKKHQRKRDGTLPVVKQSTEPPVVAPTLRVRMLKPINSRQYGTLRAGDVRHVPVETARSWVGFGLAEQDKSLDGPPETKA